MVARLGDNIAGRGGTGRAELLTTGLSILPGDGRVLTNASLLTRDGQIVALGEDQDVRPKAHNAAELDGRGYLVIPGLVNAHTHAAMGFFRGLGHGHDQMIESFLFPAERSLTAELIQPLAYSYLYAGLVSGVTCFGDHYYFVDGVAQALDRMGLRGVVGETVADLGGAFPGRKGWQHWQKQLAAWPHSPRITPAVAPHAADTVSRELLTELAQAARHHGVPLHMHLSQTAGERQRVEAREGCSPVAYAEQCGALGPTTLAVHLVSADADDVARLAATGTTAGICPASQIIYEKLAPIAALTQAGVPIALGTDCAASNDGADLLEEMRLTALLARDRGLDVAPQNILAMATSNGAFALGLGSRIGRLMPGLAADLVFLQTDLGTEPCPRPDVNLIFSLSSRNVRHVMVDGRFVLYNRRLALASEVDLLSEYQAAVAQIHRRLGGPPAKAKTSKTAKSVAPR